MTTTFVAFSPGEGNRNTLDFSVASDAKFYKMMADPSDIKFDGKGENVKSFLHRVHEHAVIRGGMKALFTVPDPIVIGVTREFLTSYGSIPMDDCRAYIQRIYNAAQRDAQDDAMLFLYLAGSLSTNFDKEIKTQPTLYMVNITRGSYPSGLLFLKLILSKAQTDTIATVSVLRKKVSNLSDKMSELQGNVVEFNTYVKDLISDFAALGARCDEITHNVFWAYLIVEDEKLVRLAERFQDKWTGAPGTPLQTFMTRAENEYNIRIQMGTWKAPTKQASEIMALKALLHQANTSSPPAKNNENNGNGNKSNTVTPFKGYAERTEEERKTKPWKFIAPKTGEKWEQQRGTITFHWCSKHEKWVTHKDSECKGVHTPNNKGSDKKKDKKVVFKAENEGENDNENDDVKVDRALISFINDSKSLF
jgi:hypothetical protein